MRKFINAILSIMLICATIGSCIVSVSADSKNDDYAYAILGSKAQTKGLNVKVGTTDIPVVKMEQGRYGWVLNPANSANSYLYVDVGESIASNVDDGTNFEVEIDYFDNSMLSSLSLRYPTYQNDRKQKVADNVSNYEVMNREAEILEFRDSKSWRTKKWVLKRATMNNGFENADFCIGAKSTFMGTARGNEMLIGAIRVKKLDTKDIIDVELVGKNIGNIFYTGENMEFDISLSADTYKAYAKNYKDAELELESKLYDYDGNLIDTKTQHVVFNPDKKTTYQVSFSPEEYGVYMLEVEAKSTEYKLSSKVKKECSYVLSAKGKIKNEKSWINITRYDPLIIEELAEVVKNAGFGGARQYYHTKKVANTAYGSNHEKASGYSMDMGKVKYSDAIKRAGLELQTYQMSEVGNHSLRYSEESPYRVPTTDEAREEWLQVDLAIIKAMGGEALKTYQIGNEWDIIQPLGDDSHARDVARLLKYCYPRIKEIYPNLEISTSGITTSELLYWEPFIEEGGLDYCDAVSMHPYTQANDPISLDPVYGSELQSRNLKAIRKYLDDSGHKDMPIYASEYGYSARKYLTPGEYHQAAWIMQQYLMYMQEGLVDRAVLFQLSCMEKWQEGEHQFGIIRYPGYPDESYGGYSGAESLGWVPNAARPSYVMMSALNHLMYDAEYVGLDNVNEDTRVYHYKKTKTNQDLLTMFTRCDAMDICYDLGTNELTYVDMYGNQTKMLSADGTYHFTVTTEPFFVMGNFKKFERRYVASVEPEETLIAANYNSEYTVKIVNRSEKNLEINVKPIEKSSVQIKSIVQPKGCDGSITLEFGDTAHIGLEAIPLTISDDSGTYYKGNLMLRYGQGAEMNVTTEYKGGEWFLITTVTNRDKQQPIKGMLECNSLQNLIEPAMIELEAGETKQVRQKFINKPDVSKLSISLVLSADTGSKYYLDTDISFVYIKYNNAVKIDGSLDEWNEGYIYFDKYEMFTAVHGFQNEYRGYSDINGKIAVSYDEKYLYLAGEIFDDAHFCTGVGENQLWSQDSIQIGISVDTEHKGPSSNFEEIAIGLLDGNPVIYRHRTALTGLTDSSKLNDYAVQIDRNDSITSYEVKMSWKDICGKDTVDYASGDPLLISIVINENDGMGRKGYYEFGGGITNVKNSEQFVRFQFIKE